MRRRQGVQVLPHYPRHDACQVPGRAVEQPRRRGSAHRCECPHAGHAKHTRPAGIQACIRIGVQLTGGGGCRWRDDGTGRQLPRLRLRTHSLKTGPAGAGSVQGPHTHLVSLTTHTLHPQARRRLRVRDLPAAGRRRPGRRRHLRRIRWRGGRRGIPQPAGMNSRSVVPFWFRLVTFFVPHCRRRCQRISDPSSDAAAQRAASAVLLCSCAQPSTSAAMRCSRPLSASSISSAVVAPGRAWLASFRWQLRMAPLRTVEHVLSAHSKPGPARNVGVQSRVSPTAAPRTWPAA